MLINQKAYSEVKGLLQKGKIEEALQLLKDGSVDKEMKELIILLEARYFNNKRHEILGQVTAEQAIVERNKMTDSILELISIKNRNTFNLYYQRVTAASRKETKTSMFFFNMGTVSLIFGLAFLFFLYTIPLFRYEKYNFVFIKILCQLGLIPISLGVIFSCLSLTRRELPKRAAFTLLVISCAFAGVSFFIFNATNQNFSTRKTFIKHKKNELLEMARNGIEIYVGSEKINQGVAFSVDPYNVKGYLLNNSDMEFDELFLHFYLFGNSGNLLHEFDEWFYDVSPGRKRFFVDDYEYTESVISYSLIESLEEKIIEIKIDISEVYNFDYLGEDVNSLKELGEYPER